MKHVPARPLRDSQRLQEDGRTEAARAGRTRAQASRDVMTVLGRLEASGAAAGAEKDQLLVVLFVHNISPVETI